MSSIHLAEPSLLKFTQNALRDNWLAEHVWKVDDNCFCNVLVTLVSFIEVVSDAIHIKVDFDVLNFTLECEEHATTFSSHDGTNAWSTKYITWLQIL